MALQRAYSGVGFDSSMGGGGPGDPLGTLQMGMYNGRDAVLSQLKKVAKGERSSDEDALLDLMEMTDFFSGGHESTTSLPFCGTSLRAWVETIACSASVETQHPMASTDPSVSPTNTMGSISTTTTFPTITTTTTPTTTSTKLLLL